MVSRDIAAPPAHSWSTWHLLSLVLWVVPMVVISIMVVARPGHRSVTPVYHQAVDQWWAHQPLYEGTTGFHYLPHFTAMFIPYHLAGNRLGDILWRSTAGIGLAVGLWLFCGAITHRQPDRWRAFALTTLFVLPLSLPALQNGQANTQFGVALLLAAWCLHAQRWTAAAVCLWLATGIKPLGLAAMGLAWAAYPQLWWRLAVGLPIFLAFPFTFGPPGYVWSQCLAAWDNLRLCSVATEHRFADLNGLLRTLSIPLTGMASLAVRAGAGAALMLFCYSGARREAEPRRSLLWLSAAAGFLMLFNPMTEANSYVILAPVLGLMALWEWTRGIPSLGWLFAGMALTMGMLPNLVRPLFGNAFALAWHPAMTIGFLSLLVWQVVRPHRVAVVRNVPVTDKEENPMVSWIVKYDAALADKPFLASIYDSSWRQKIRSRLLSSGNVCYIGNAFGYQAPLLETCGLIRQGWQCKLERGAEFLLPKLSDGETRHLTQRMRDTESTSAEEELLLARGFALEFGEGAVSVPQTPSDKPRPEFEVDASGHRILVEAKGRTMAESVEQEREQRRKVESLLGIQIQSPPPLDDKVDQWIKNTVFGTLRSKSERDSGFVLVLSLYTLPEDLGVTALNTIRELTTNPGNPTCFRKNPSVLDLSPEHWPLAMALVSGGSIWGVWFNSAVRERLRIDMRIQERIRVAIKNSFYPREDGVFFHEGMTDDEHRSGIDRMFGVGAQ